MFLNNLIMILIEKRHRPDRVLTPDQDQEQDRILTQDQFLTPDQDQDRILTRTRTSS